MSGVGGGASPSRDPSGHLRGRLPPGVALQDGDVSRSHLDPDRLTASGITRSLVNGQWIPGHVLFDHLGFHISTLDYGLLKVPECRCRILRALSRDLLHTSAVSLRQVYSDKLSVFTGTAVSCSVAIPQAILRLRSLFDDQEKYSPRSVLQRDQLRDLAWWEDLQFDSPTNGCLLWPP